MDMYSFLRELAGSWILLVLDAVLLGLSCLRSGRAWRLHRDAAESIFRNGRTACSRRVTRGRVMAHSDDEHTNPQRAGNPAGLESRAANAGEHKPSA